MHESVLVYRGFFYLKVMAAIVAAAVVAYLAHEPLGAPNGGTWLGYTLGTVGLLLIVWLAWFGVRKRRYGVGKVRLEDWLSGHVYLGLGLVVVATLHTGFQFGWNVHTLAYALMILVIASGVFGLYAYVRFPRLMTENRQGLTLDQLMGTIADLDKSCHEIAMALGDEVNELVRQSTEKTRIGGGAWRQLSGADPDCPTAFALGRVKELVKTVNPELDEIERKLVLLLARKNELLIRARRDVQLKAIMDVWLYVHVPLTFALLAALVAHVVSVFFYW
jgi:hypothetical protein